MRTNLLDIAGLVKAALATACLAATLPATTAARQGDSPSLVWYGNTTPVPIADLATTETLFYVDGVGSPILDVRVSLQIFHTLDADLDISLVGPDGTTVDLTSDNGGTGGNFGSACTPESSRTTFDDAAATAITDGSAPFIGTFRPEQPLSAFDGKTGSGSANGIWRLRITDDAAGNTGSLQCWSLFIDAAITAPLALDDAYTTPINTPLVVPAPGVLANDDASGGGAMTAAVVAQPTHGFLTFFSNGGFNYTPSVNYTGTDSFAYRAFNGVGTVGSNVAWVHLTVAPPPPTAVNDAYTTPFETPLTVAAPGVLANDDNPVPLSSMIAGLRTDPSHGSLTFNENGSFLYIPAAGYFGPDSFTYNAINTGGASNEAAVLLTVGPPTTARPPTDLYASSIVGTVVTLRWTPPAAGAAPTQYVLEGGLAPGQVLASFPTGSPYPVFTFVAPTGSFYARVHTLAGANRSAASNEIRLHVNVPVPPSAPADLLSLVNGSTLNLAWRNTFAGGAPNRMALEVTGAFTGSLPLTAGDAFGFAGVPGGTYTLRLYAVNAGGVSPPSNPVTVTFPGPCSGPPLTPSGFLAYRLGNVVFVTWDPATSGPAPTGDVVHVTGAFNGSFPTSGRALSSPVAPGAYNLSVVATNACGTSAATPVQTVMVP
jgi:subtilisin-like proprotein convertase family protein